MMTNRFEDFIQSRPRESLQILPMIIFLFWQSISAIAGLALYLLFSKYYRLNWWITLLIGAVVAIGAAFFQLGFSHGTIRDFKVADAKVLVLREDDPFAPTALVK